MLPSRTSRLATAARAPAPKAVVRPRRRLVTIAVPVLVSWLSAAAPGAESCAALDRQVFPGAAPQDLARDPNTGNYFVTLLLNGVIAEVTPDLKERVRTLPSPFAAGEMLTGIAYDTHSDTLWVIQPQVREIAEIERDGQPTLRVLAPEFLPVVNPLGSPVPRGMDFHAAGDDGKGSLYVVESTGSQIYEVALDGRVIRRFDHPDDPDGFPGDGRSAVTSDIAVLTSEDGSLDGFFINGRDAARGGDFLRRLDREGQYTGLSVPLVAVGGTTSSFVIDSWTVDSVMFEPVAVVLADSRAETVVIDAALPPAPEIFDLSCELQDEDIELSWVNLFRYDRIEVFRNDRLLAVTDGTADRFTDSSVPQGTHRYHVTAHFGELETSTGECRVTVGPGRVLAFAEFEGDTAFDLTLDDDDRLLVSDFDRRSIFVYDLNLRFIEEIVVQPLAGDRDRLGGIAFRPDTGNILVYNAITEEIVEIDYTGEAVVGEPIQVALPHDPEDPDDDPSVGGIDYVRGETAADGSIWLVETRTATIYEIDMQGEIVASAPHPDAGTVEVPDDPRFAPYMSGISVVPGTGGEWFDLSGGGVLDFDSTRILRFRPADGTVDSGREVPLAGLDEVCSHSHVGIVGRRVDGVFRLFATTIERNGSCLAELDPGPPALRRLTRLTCDQDGLTSRARLRFSGNDTYDRIDVWRDGELLQSLPPDASGFDDDAVAPGQHAYEVIAAQGELRTPALRCEVRIGAGAVLRKALLNAPSLDQIARDPVDGAFFLSSSSNVHARTVFRLDADLEALEPLEDVLEPPRQIASLAVRREPDGARSLYAISRTPRQGLDDRTDLRFHAVSLDGEPIESFPLDPPIPANGFTIYPVGLVWSPRTDSFFYLERNSRTFVQIDPRGQTLREFSHPAPPTQSFVFNVGLTDLDHGDGLLATTAAPCETRITRAVHVTPQGRRTAWEVPLDGADLDRVADIVAVDTSLYIVGSRGGLSTIVEVEAFDPIPRPVGLACRETPAGLSLTWTNTAAYDELILYRDTEEIARLDGSRESHVVPPDDDASIDARSSVFSLRARVDDEFGPPSFCQAPDDASEVFTRGDVDGNGEHELTDAIVLLAFLFLGGSDVACFDAADADDSGELDISDPIRLLEYQFLGAGPLPSPFFAAGVDPTADAITCASAPGV